MINHRIYLKDCFCLFCRKIDIKPVVTAPIISPINKTPTINPERSVQSIE